MSLTSDLHRGRGRSSRPKKLSRELGGRAGVEGGEGVPTQGEVVCLGDQAGASTTLFTLLTHSLDHRQLGSLQAAAAKAV